MFSTTTTKMKGVIMSKLLQKFGVVLALILAMIPGVYQTAQAASGGPKDSVITLQTPFLDAKNTWDAVGNQQMADGWVAKGWFGSGLVFQVSFAPVGSTINLTYNVKDKSGKPLAFTPVNLRINKGYSEASSIVEVDGVKTKGVDRPPFDQANVIHRTDAFGNVTFAMKSLDMESLAEEEPDSYTSKPKFSDDKLDRLHSQVLPEVNSEPADHSVITEFHYYKPKTPIIVPASKPSITLITPKLDSTNSVIDEAKNLKQAYAPLGSDLVVVYKVTGDDGRAVTGKSVTLKVNEGKGVLKAVTDAFGYAAFTLKNSDTTPISIPAKPNSPVPAGSSAFATLVPEIEGSDPVLAEKVEFHYFRGVTTSYSKSGKNYILSVAVAGAIGKTAEISVTGVAKVNSKIKSAVQVVPVKVTPGMKTVVVKIDGKTYTSKINIK